MSLQGHARNTWNARFPTRVNKPCGRLRPQCPATNLLDAGWPPPRGQRRAVGGANAGTHRSAWGANGPIRGGVEALREGAEYRVWDLSTPTHDSRRIATRSWRAFGWSHRPDRPERRPHTGTTNFAACQCARRTQVWLMREPTSRAAEAMSSPGSTVTSAWTVQCPGSSAARDGW